MSYSDYTQTSNSQAAAQKVVDDRNAAYAAGNSSHGDVGDFLNDTFGKAKDVGAPNPDWSTSLYGGSVDAANANQTNLKYQGYSGMNSADRDGGNLYDIENANATRSQAAGTQANAQGQQVAQGGLGAQQQAVSGIGNWLQQGPGPSVAQAQLQQGNNQNVANMMAMAASGRGQGGGAAAQQAAAFQGANAGQQTNEQAATLRAQEAQSWKQNQLSAMGQQANIGASMTGAGQNQQNLGLSYQQLAENQQQSGAGSLLNFTNAGNQNNQYFQNLGQQQLANQTQAASGLENTRITAQEKADEANQASTYKHQGGTSGLIAAGAGALAMLSDVRTKENIEEDNPLDYLKSYKFDYKDKTAKQIAEQAAQREYARAFEDAKSPRLGVMAQDMAQSRAGGETVVNTPGGLAIDHNRALSFLLSSQAKLNSRIHDLEGSK